MLCLFMRGFVRTGQSAGGNRKLFCRFGHTGCYNIDGKSGKIGGSRDTIVRLRKPRKNVMAFYKIPMDLRLLIQ